MAEIELRGITKHFGKNTALENVSFELKDGEFFVLLGPTGAGKTTSLRIIAGLEKQDAGRVLFNGQVADALTLPTVTLPLSFNSIRFTRRCRSTTTWLSRCVRQCGKHLSLK